MQMGISKFATPPSAEVGISGNTFTRFALGRLRAREKLWGKARSYFEASLSVEGRFDAHMELARLLDELGEAEASRVHYRRSLELAESALRKSAGRGVATEPRSLAVGVQMPA